MITLIFFKQKGDFLRIDRFLRRQKTIDVRPILEKYGARGVNALSAHTPKDTGTTANSWGYKVDVTSRNASLIWYNSNRPSGFSVALSLQYGHGTGWGGYVQGMDYINPAMRPILNGIVDEIWAEVVKS